MVPGFMCSWHDALHGPHSSSHLTLVRHNLRLGDIDKRDDDI
jgi:hypothetical protein